MLATIEAYFHDIVDDELDAGVLVVRGRHRGAHDEVDAVVEVTGERLELTSRADADDRARRLGPVHMVLVAAWDGDGDTREFTLPETHDGPLLGVESPPGSPLRADDDYVLADRVIRLRRPARAGPAAVLARVQGPRGRGVLARDHCVVEVSARVFARSPTSLDAVVSSVCAAMLRASVVMPILEGRAPASSGVSLRLLEARARWVSTSRRELDDPPLPHESTLVFRTEGLLEQRVVLAGDDPATSIQRVVVRELDGARVKKKTNTHPQES